MEKYCYRVPKINKKSYHHQYLSITYPRACGGTVAEVATALELGVKKSAVTPGSSSVINKHQQQQQQ
jgi:hypothetical protein